jgi:ATP-GRASP peptide maturase of grasp-with-spasm system
MSRYHLIFKDEEDQSSNMCIDWLTYSEREVQILNNDNLAVLDFTISVNSVDFLLVNNSVKIKFTDIKSYWLRRGQLNLITLPIEDTINTISKSAKFQHLKTENTALHYSILEFIYSKHGIGKIIFNETSKLYNLGLASNLGLQVPSTSVSSFKNNIEKHTSQYKCCTKAIRQGWYTDGTTSYNGPTKLVRFDDIGKIEYITWPSLLQEYQEKRYELRIFYLDGDFYTSAIFSQNDEQTKVDFRNYNNARPNRTPPYQLPTEIEEKLHKLMQKLTIKCGSIDMVVNTKNEFIFLEVNPFGQFQQVSYPCNYYLELQVANYLTKYD